MLWKGWTVTADEQAKRSLVQDEVKSQTGCGGPSKWKADEQMSGKVVDRNQRVAQGALEDGSTEADNYS